MNPSRLITVITPSHNTPYELFKTAYDSMMSQQLSKEKIDWVIVVHNSDEEHLKEVKELTKDQDFIRVFELHNDKKTASSPRNFGLDQVEGKYVTFLDADDCLTPECLKVITEGMEQSGAQVGKFRSEKREEDEDVISFLDNRVSFDQTKSLIVLDREDKTLNKLMTMANMMMSCQVVKSSYLEEHHIRFREDIRIYEDVVFNLECLKNAQTVAVFPQLIGYIYFMRHGSTMQQLRAPSAQEIVNVCRDVATQLRIGLDAGLYMRNLFFGHMKLISDMIESAEKESGAPLSDWAKDEICDLLQPFFLKIDPPLPERKFLSQEEIDKMMQHFRQVILGEEEIDKEEETKALYRILRDNEYTDLGEDWGFDTIRSSKVFAEKVPVTDYDFYAPMIELMTRIGESGIMVADPVIGYAIRYGSMGTPKRFPVTEKSLLPQIEEFKKFLESEGSVFLMAESLRPARKYADHVYPDSSIGIILQYLKNSLVYCSYDIKDRKQKAGALTSPRGLVLQEHNVQSTYARMIFALLDPDVGRIVSPFVFNVLYGFRMLELHHERIVDDIEKGTISDTSEYTEEERKELLGMLRPDPERAKQLRKIFAGGFDGGIIKKIWPNITDIVAFADDDQKIYKDLLRRYTGDIPIRNGWCVFEEGLLGVEVPGEDGIYRIANEDSHFEFLPQEQLCPGKEYRVLLTSSDGLYRYMLDYVIEISRLEKEHIFFKCLHRITEKIDLEDGSGAIDCGELSKGIHSLMKHLPFILEDYSLCQSFDENRLILYLEPSTIDDSYKKITNISLEELGKMVDEALLKYSSAYKKARALGTLEKIKTEIVEPQTHVMVREVTAHLQGLPIESIRPVHILHNPSRQRIVKRMVLKY